MSVLKRGIHTRVKNYLSIKPVNNDTDIL